MSILYSHFIIRKAKNISSFGEKVVWNYQILEEIRNVNNVTPSLYNMKKMRPRKRKFLTCLRSQSYSKTSPWFPLKLPSHTHAMPQFWHITSCAFPLTCLSLTYVILSKWIKLQNSFNCWSTRSSLNLWFCKGAKFDTRKCVSLVFF